DMEHYEAKDLTLQLFRELVGEPALDGLEAGVVVQAYLKDSYDDLADVIAWSSGRHTPVSVRLVKGAYWDTETVVARAEGWPVPGMAYLVRRRLENTSNESFVRHRFAEGRELDELLAPPVVDDLPRREPPAPRATTDPAAPGPYEHEPVAEWRRAEARAAFGA